MVCKQTNNFNKGLNRIMTMENQEYYHYIQQTKGCPHMLQYNETQTNKQDSLPATEPATPLTKMLTHPCYSFSLKELIQMTGDVAAAWKECRDRGVLYRDIQTRNIYRTEDGTYKLGDLTSCTNDFNAMETVGNQWFMAPETFGPGIFTERSAVYSLSMVMYFILNRLRPAFWQEGREKRALYQRMRGEELPMPAIIGSWDPDITEEIRLFFRNTLAFYPEYRLQTLNKFQESLQRLSTTLGPRDYIISILNDEYGFDINAGNEERIHDAFKYISLDIYSRLERQDYARPHQEIPYRCCPPQLEQDLRNIASRPVKGSPAPKKTDKTPSAQEEDECMRAYLRKQANEDKGNATATGSGGEHPAKVYSSVFAPAEVKRKSRLMVQVYLHLKEESEHVVSLATESDRNTGRRDYRPLQIDLKRGDTVEVELCICGETNLMQERKQVIWQDSFTKCSFSYLVPKDLDEEELYCEVNFYVNHALKGEMQFITRIVEHPRDISPEITSRIFKRIFISYAHEDIQQVKNLALAYKAQGVDYFFDRDSLGGGDIYEEKILEFIDTADLFILCWSQHAAESCYVQKEKDRALLRAYPQTSREKATIKIYPISMEPRAALPKDMEEIYNFEVL